VSDEATAVFETHRRYLRGVAYRMLGSVSDADDVVQEAFLRWHGADVSGVAEPRAFLTRVTTRLCLDHLKSARVRRESYVGVWLPEPVPTDAGSEWSGSREDISVALLVTLERLSPLERAAFLLHDVFDVDFGSVAEALERSEAACRQLAARAREHVRRERPRFEATPETRERVMAAFHGALVSGDAGALSALLAEDAVLYTDGGGKRVAARNPIDGRPKIMRFYEGIARKYGLPPAESIELCGLNGLPGLLLHTPEGMESIAIEVNGERIAAIYAMRNPEKLRHLL
jgi:RNA polymerase sigma-70 factor (ECF subfamily)